MKNYIMDTAILWVIAIFLGFIGIVVSMLEQDYFGLIFLGGFGAVIILMGTICWLTSKENGSPDWWR